MHWVIHSDSMLYNADWTIKCNFCETDKEQTAFCVDWSFYVAWWLTFMFVDFTACFVLFLPIKAIKFFCLLKVKLKVWLL